MPEGRPERFCFAVLATGGLWLALTSFAAAQGLRLGGQVVDPQQRPVAGAELKLHSMPSVYSLDRALLGGALSEAVSSVRSDREGRFELEAPAAGMWLLTATAEGRIEVGVFLHPLLGPRELQPIVLKAAREVWIEVVDGSGQPAPTARIVLDAWPGRRATYASDASRARAWPRRQAGLTDETGRLRLLAPESGKYMLQVNAEGFAPWSEDPRSSSSERVVLRRGAPRALLVRDPDGRPISQALVRLESGEATLTLTDEQGRASLYVPRGEDLAVRILSLEGGDASATLRAEGSAAPLEILVEPAVPLAGLVLTARERTPVAGAVVWSSSDRTSFTRSDESGRYRLHLSSRSRGSKVDSLSAAAEGYFPAASDLAAARWGEGRGPTLLLRPAAIVRGVVVDGEGRAIAGAAVHELAVVDRPATARSGSDGGFVLSPLAPGRNLRLQASREGYTPTVVEVPPVSGQRPVDVRIQMLDGRLAYGTVVDQAERPIAAALVTLTPRNSAGLAPADSHSPPIRARSGNRGRFELRDITSGAFDLRAQASGFAPVTVPGVEIPKAGREVDLGTLVLVEDVSIEGRITDVQGDPLADAEVRVHREASLPAAKSELPGKAMADAASDADGRFVIADLAPGQTVELRVALAGYAPAALRAVRAPTDRPLEIVLEDVAVLRGTVGDERGAPVSGARLRLVAEPGSTADSPARDSTSLTRFASTDASGSFEIQDVIAGRWDLIVGAEGFQDGGEEAIEVVAGEAPEAVRVVLRPGAVVRGRVAGLGGESVASARVSALSANRPPFHARPYRSATTDSDGNYRLDGLPAGPTSFSVEHPDYSKQARDLEVRPGGGNLLDFELEDGGEISGRVVDAGGRPVSGARVRALPPGEGVAVGREAEEPIVTGGDGSFTVSVLAQGSYIVRAEKSGYASAQTEEAVQVEGRSAYGIELRLERGGAIAGRVTGLEFDELSEVRILALQPGRSVPPATGRVDYEGRYRLESLPEGEWMVIAAVEQTGKTARETITLDSGAEEVILDLEFGGGLTLSGQVVRTSKPVPGARIKATATEAFSGSWAMTDQEGRFRLESLDPGTYEVVVSGLIDGPEQQEVVRLDSDREILIELRGYTLRGQVLDDLEGTPIPGANVALTPTERQRAGLSSVLRTDARGVFRLAGVAPGSYRLRVGKEGYGNGNSEVEVDERSGAPAIEVRLRPSEGLTLYVLHSTGAPAVDVSLMALDTAGQTLLAGRYSAGEGGRIRLGELPAGTWTLLAAAPGTATVRQGVEAPGRPVIVRLPEAGGLAVRVPALVGTGRRARLTLRDHQGQPYRDVHTARDQWDLLDGTATVPLIPAGVWALEVRTADEELIWTAGGRVISGRVLDLFVE